MRYRADQLKAMSPSFDLIYSAPQSRRSADCVWQPGTLNEPSSDLSACDANNGHGHACNVGARGPSCTAHRTIRFLPNPLPRKRGVLCAQLGRQVRRGAIRRVPERVFFKRQLLCRRIRQDQARHPSQRRVPKRILLKLKLLCGVKVGVQPLRPTTVDRTVCHS